MDWTYIADLGISTLIFAPGLVLLALAACWGAYGVVSVAVNRLVGETEAEGGTVEDAAMPLMAPAMCDEQEE